MRHRRSTAGARATAATLPGSARLARASALALALLVCAMGACGGGRAESTPVAMLASSPRSAAAFEAIREAWGDSDTRGPRRCEPRSSASSRSSPRTVSFPLARVALALDGDAERATSRRPTPSSRSTADVASGTTRELRTVARARRARLGGDPETALVLLRPSVGKSVDPLARTIFEEELTLTAVATHRDYEAISYMDAWLRASTPDEKPGTSRESRPSSSACRARCSSARCRP